MSLDDRDDDELMLLARAGAEGAFAVLVGRHEKRALRFAARQLHVSSQLVDDVVQNAFLNVYLKLSRYEARGQFRAFLFQILLNQCRMAGRAARVEARWRTRSATDHVPLAGPGQEEELLIREQRRHVEAAVSRLSDKLRDVVLLRWSGELSYEEIAATLRIPVGTVKRRLFTAIRKLRRLMGGRR
jgi:RNA polymerase sigma-70 factor (ECF subfamily)